MSKSYHEHCMEERIEAQSALSAAKEKEKNNVTIRYFISKSRQPIMTVPRGRLAKTIAKLEAQGYIVLTVDGKPYSSV